MPPYTKFLCWSLNPSVTIFEDIGSIGWDPNLKRSVSLQEKKRQETFLSLQRHKGKAIWGHWKGSLLQARKRCITRNQLSRLFDSKLHSLQNYEKVKLRLRLPSSGIWFGSLSRQIYKLNILYYTSPSLFSFTSRSYVSAIFDIRNGK